MPKQYDPSPTQKLWQAVSDFLVGFSIFLIIAGLIGTVFVLQDLEENTSQDLRSEANTTQITTSPTPPACEVIDVCLQADSDIVNLESCTPRVICDMPENCSYQEELCTTETCEFQDSALICPNGLDDIYFADQTGLATPYFFLDPLYTTQVLESDLQAGRAYYFKVTAAIQNYLKDTINPPNLQGVYITVSVNGQELAREFLSYALLTNNEKGYTVTLSGNSNSFFYANTVNTMIFEIEPISNHDTYSGVEETNYQNNILTHRFSATTCSNNSDINNDNKTDLRDFSLLNREFLTTKLSSPADSNCDGRVDIIDYSIMARNFTFSQ